MEKRILIVEDEVIIAEDLALFLQDQGFAIEGPVDNGPDALQLLSGNQVDLALLDINIQGAMSGIDIGRELRDRYEIPFIFITSYYDEETLKRVESAQPAAYIVKPFKHEEVLLNIRLALQKHQYAKSPKKDISKLLVRDAGLLKPIDPDEIAYLKAESNYTKIVMRAGDEYLQSHTLKTIEEKLPGNVFCRVHKSYIINLNCIELIEGNSLQVRGQCIPIGRSHRAALFDRMEVL